MIDLRRLQALRVLHQHGTVTAAAQALHLTPSAVSQQIRLLSQELGVELLRREGRRVHLTPAARTLLDHADLLQAQWELARADLDAHTEGGLGELRIASFPTGLASFVAPAALRLRAEHPRLAVRMSEVEIRGCFDRLLSGDVDIAVLVPLPGTPPPDDPRFRQFPLWADPQDLIVPAGHPLAARPSVALAEAAYEPWIAAPDTVDCHQEIMVACATAGFTPRIVHEVQEWNAIASLVAHGFGVCLMPRLAPILPSLDVVRVPLHGVPTPSRHFLACVRRGSERRPAIAHGLAALHAVAAGLETSAPVPAEAAPAGV
ncbi:LysR family transcriptional regulator [Allonocardiopsis opalescens]|uniref:DNA-binding transcriptional LysR family regulator n=1 Tax=Allonocardiopsis opalescens TaxID=1144618 RepID=A0A2T0Q5L5_9ACTN|nr:LysR family transcriptional regulator [Allonocardiopsis opalescens]PRX99073.1 DNA-binding transcriptional LysR family regulator [Allonocardiopsis opalescens]